MSEGYEAFSYQGYPEALEAESLAQELNELGEQLAWESQSLFDSRRSKMSKTEIDNINTILDKMIRKEPLSSSEQSALVDYISPLAPTLKMPTPLTYEGMQRTFLEEQILEVNSELKELTKTYKDVYGMDAPLE